MSKTSVTFLLDRTGSMESIKDDTIGGFNAYLDGLQQSGEDIEFTLVQFDSQGLDKVCVRVPVKDAVKLTKDNYEPRAATPLIDAAYKTIKAVEASLNGAEKIIVCIQTDGQENASTEYTWEQLNALIKDKTAAGWQFNFMGTGIDAYDTGTRMGVSTQNTMSNSPQNMAEAMASTARAHSAYSSGVASTTAYTGAERFASGDMYADKYGVDGNPNQTVTAPQAGNTAPVIPKQSMTSLRPHPGAAPYIPTTHKKPEKPKSVDDFTL